MNEATAANCKLAEGAHVTAETIKARHANAKLHVDQMMNNLMRENESKSRQSAMREQACQYADASARIARDGVPPDDDLEPAAREAEGECMRISGEERAVARDIENLNAWYQSDEADVAKLETIRAALVVHQQAIAILGRNGAQKRLAESALTGIAAMANESLRDANIDLSVDITWSREGQGLTDECDSCGAAFPKGRAVKECSRCGATRGPKTVDRIEVELSDTSGAAEDLAGVVIQLAAGAWLRSRRDSLWSAAFIDEPFGSLDGENKRALSTHLSTLLRGRYGFEQAFVVAHDRGIMDSMPGRIIVTADDSCSRLAVG